MSSTQRSSILPPDFEIKPRNSVETDRRHLLSESIAPSESASIISFGDGERTPRAGSPSRVASTVAINATTDRRETIADPTPTPYRGFRSEAHYLAALRAWAEDRKYVQHEQSLIGFYGVKSMDDYATGPGLDLNLRRKWRERKQKKADARRDTVG